MTRFAVLCGVVLCACASARGAEVSAVRMKDGNVSFDNGLIRGVVSARGFIGNAGAASLPGVLHVPVRNAKGQGIAGTMVDGHVSDWPRVFFTPETLKTEAIVREEGPLRAVIVTRMSGVCRNWVNLPAGARLEIERTFVVKAGCPVVGTRAVYTAEKPFPRGFSAQYPCVPLGMRLPDRKEGADRFSYALPGAAGEVTRAETGVWLNRTIDAEPAWIQFHLPAPPVPQRAACLGYILPPAGRLSGITRFYKTGDEAFSFCEFAHTSAAGGKSSFVLPLGYVFADRSHVAGGGECVAEHLAKRYAPDGTPRGLVASSSESRKSVNGRTCLVAAVAVRETLGLERRGEIVEVSIGGDGPLSAEGRLYDASFDVRKGTGTELKYQLKNDDPAARAIVFEVPSVPASGAAAFHFVLPDAVR